MDAVIFDGKEYLKASIVAERFNYTQDYVGQLCRGKKVDARLVGRAWYINLDSLQTHKKARYKEKRPENVFKTDIPAPPPKYLSRIDVEPVLKKKTVKLMRNVGDTLSEFAVKYESDDHSLIPHINRDSVNHAVAVLPAEAEELDISNSKEAVKVTNFKADPLPEVYLKGKLRVNGLPEDLEEELKADIEPQAHVVSPTIKTVEATHHQSQKTDSEFKKPIKIKLYRNNSGSAGIGTSVGGRSPHRELFQPTNKAHSVVRPIPPRLSVKRQVPVQARVFEHRAQTVQAPRSETVIPFATLKAVFILLLTSTATAGLLLVQNVTAVSDKSTLSSWSISFEQVQKIESLISSK